MGFCKRVTNGILEECDCLMEMQVEIEDDITCTKIASIISLWHRHRSKKMVPMLQTYNRCNFLTSDAIFYLCLHLHEVVTLRVICPLIEAHQYHCIVTKVICYRLDFPMCLQSLCNIVPLKVGVRHICCCVIPYIGRSSCSQSLA